MRNTLQPSSYEVSIEVNPVFERKAATSKGKPIAESTAPKRNPFKVSRVIVDKFDWKHKVDSPIVEDAIDHFTKFMCRNG